MKLFVIVLLVLLHQLEIDATDEPTPAELQEQFGSNGVPAAVPVNTAIGTDNTMGVTSTQTLPDATWATTMGTNQSPFNPNGSPVAPTTPCPADVVCVQLKKLFQTREDMRTLLKNSITVNDVKDNIVRQNAFQVKGLIAQIQADTKLTAPQKTELIRRANDSVNQLNLNVNTSYQKLVGSKYATSLISQINDVNNIPLIARLLNYIDGIVAKSNELLALLNNLNSNYLAKELNTFTLSVQDILNNAKRVNPQFPITSMTAINGNTATVTQQVSTQQTTGTATAPIPLTAV